MATLFDYPCKICKKNKATVSIPFASETLEICLPCFDNNCNGLMVNVGEAFAKFKTKKGKTK